MELSPIGPCSGLSCEIFFILVSQGAAKLPEDRIEGPKAGVYPISLMCVHPRF